MAAPTILLVADDPRLIEAVRREVETLGGPPLWVEPTVGRALGRAAGGDVGAVLVHFAGGVEVADVEALVRLVSARPAPAPVVVLSRDLYDAGEASVLFQVGAADYLGLADHLDRLAAVLGALTAPPAPRPLPIPAARVVPERRVPLADLLASLF